MPGTPPARRASRWQQASAANSEGRARAIYAAVAGAQLLACSRADLALYDSLIDNYRAAGLLPA